jgi:hypothetical protein
LGQRAGGQLVVLPVGVDGAAQDRVLQDHVPVEQARELGADVMLLEAEQVGGPNIDRGPTPVCTLARAARLARDWSLWERFGLEAPPAGAQPGRGPG